MPEHFVTRLLIDEPAQQAEPEFVRYAEDASLTVDAAQRPYVLSAGAGPVATVKTMDIDTRNIRDRGPDE